MSEASSKTVYANTIGALLTVFLCAATLYLIYIVTSDKDMPDKILSIVMYVLGFLTAKISTVVDWCFGTTSDAKKNTETIAMQAGTIAAAQNALTPPAPTVVIPPGGQATVAASDSPTP